MEIHRVEMLNSMNFFKENMLTNQGFFNSIKLFYERLTFLMKFLNDKEPFFNKLCFKILPTEVIFFMNDARSKIAEL